MKARSGLYPFFIPGEDPSSVATPRGKFFAEPLTISSKRQLASEDIRSQTRRRFKKFAEKKATDSGSKRELEMLKQKREMINNEKNRASARKYGFIFF